VNVPLATGLASLLDALHVELVTTGYAWTDPEVSSDGRVATWLVAGRGLQVECHSAWSVTGLIYTLSTWRLIEARRAWATSETNAAVLWTWLHERAVVT